MALSLPLPPAGFDDLPVEERIDYVQLLWERIAARPGDVPVPDWHKDVIRDRLESYRSNPDTGREWPEFRDALLRKLRSRPS
jgi:putative addiction module component (TIGR02574 family)